jgi:hypothetical protein
LGSGINREYLKENLVRETDVQSLPNGRENLSSGIGLDIPASSHHDDTHDPKEKGQCQTLGTAPGIENLADRQLGKTTDDARDDGDNGCQRVPREVTDDEGVERSEDNLLDRNDEVDEPDPGKSVSIPDSPELVS